MAVAYFTGALSTSASGVASQTATLSTSGCRCGVIFAITYAAASVFTTATIDGVACPAVTGGEASDTATEAGNVKAYFLDNINQGASKNFVVNRTNNATVSLICGLSLTAASACEVHLPGIVLLQEDGAYAEQSVTDGSPGTNSVRVAAGYYGGSTPPPVGGATTIVSSRDESAFGCNFGRETTAGQGARNIGFAQATSDDRAAVHFAVREVPVVQIIPDVVMAQIVVEA